MTTFIIRHDFKCAVAIGGVPCACAGITATRLQILLRRAVLGMHDFDRLELLIGEVVGVQQSATCVSIEHRTGSFRS